MINKPNTTMTTLVEKFRTADKKVTEIENNGGLYLGEAYGSVGSTNEYNEALQEAQSLYAELEKLGIDPFAE